MKTVITLLCILALSGVAVGASQSATSQPTPMEKDAIITNVTPKQIEAMVGLTRLYGYRCDSISSARPFVLSYGYTLVCNNYRYTYEIEDKGGNWRVTVK